MADDESFLLRRFAQNGDAEAFSEIVKRYADPVYSTCRRILFDEAGAADAAQETFYQFMISAGSIKGSPAAWLHAVATSKAIDAIRRNAARTSRERRYFFSKAKEVSQWKDISPHIDRELETLSPPHRDVLIRYFFEGKTMAEIAKLNKTSQPTVSRLVNAAVEELRKRFLKKGLIVTLFVLKGIIDRQTLQAAPMYLLTEAGKMSLVGTTTGHLSSSAAVSSTTGISAAGTELLPTIAAGSTKTTIAAAMSTLKAKVAGVIVVTTVGAGGVFVYHHHKDTHSSAADAETVAAIVTEDLVEPAAPEMREPMLLSGQTGTGMGGGFGGATAQPAAEDETPVNLSDPQITIDTFTELLAAGNLDRCRDCFVPGSTAFDDFYRVMTDPQNGDQRQLQNAFHSIGDPVEILELLETETGLAVKLLYTVHSPFTLDGELETLTWAQGDEFEVNLELVNSAGEWKVETIY